MREILFRGKKSGNGEWIEGWYCIDEYNKPRIWIKEPDNSLNWYLVIPETVGQYTGLKDKNGKMIFEGDMVFDHYWKTNDETSIVSFSKGLASFVHTTIKRKLWSYLHQSAHLEIISTIHDSL